MQIMPTTSSSILSLTDSYFIGADFQGSSAANFADELNRQQEARDAVANDESHSVKAALDSDEPRVTPLSQAPYNLTTNNGVTYTTEEVIFTQSELKELERDLRREGAPEDSLEELKKLTEQPDGSTLGEVMVALQSQRNYPSLSTTESETLKGLTKKIDPSGNLYSTVMGHLNNRDGKSALEALTKGMGNLSGAGVTVTQDELAVLAKAMGLSNTASQQMFGLFGSEPMLTLNQAQFTSLMGPAFNDFSVEASNMKKLSDAVDKTLGTLLQEAKERMAAEKDATELSSRKTEQSKVVIEKTVLENVNSTLEGTRASQLDAQLETQLKKQADETLETKLLNAKDVSANQELSENMQHAGQDFLNEHNSRNTTQDDAWAQLLQKASTRSATTNVSATQNITTPVLGIGGLTATNTQQLAQNIANAQAQRTQMSMQAAAQVEKALLTAAKDGSKSLELQLHPAELGSLNITLTARNGEVTAMLRSERSETAELLQKQLEFIRSQLEDQGVKIEKIEVRQGTQENSASYDTWDGMDNHNARQEENAQKELFERLRNLGRMRNSRANTEETDLARHMHIQDNTAGNAAQSLYIVT